MPGRRAALGRAGAALVIAAALALPFVAQTYYVQFATKVLLMGLLAMALNFVVGFGGLVSLCHAAFFGCTSLRNTPVFCPSRITFEKNRSISE